MRKLYAAYVNSRLGTPEERARALESAFRHRDRLTENERLHTEGTYYWGRDRARAIAAYERLVARDSSKGLVNLAQLLASRRELARAETLQRAASRHNAPAVIAHTNLVQVLLHRGRIDEADSALRHTRERFPHAPVVPYLAATIECVRSTGPACEARLDSLRSAAAPEIRVRSTQLLANVALMRGQLGRASRLDDEWLALDSARGGAASALSRGLRSASIELIVGESTRASARLGDFGEPQRAEDAGAVAAAHARLGQPGRARAMLMRHERRGAADSLTPVQRSAIREAWAEIALAEGDWRSALVGFRAADILPDGPRDACEICLPLVLARAYDIAGIADSAIAMYARYVREPHHPRFESDALHLAPTLDRLAVLHERAGHREEAARYSERFIELWRHADPELQPRVAAARARLAALRRSR